MIASSIGGCFASSVRDPALDDLLLAVPFGDAIGGVLGVPGQVPDRGQDALELQHGVVIGPERGRDRLQGRLQDGLITLGVQGEAVVVILDMERRPLPGHAKFAALEDLAIEVPQEGQEDAAAVLGARRGPPVDVEVIGVGGGLPVLKNVVPPWVLVSEDAHVVGHDVQDQPQAMIPERLQAARQCSSGVPISGLSSW